LTNLDPSSDEVDTPTPHRQRQSSTSVYPALYPSPPVSPEDADPYMYHPSAAAAVRGRSVGKDDPAKEVTKIKDKYIRHGSLPVSKRLLFFIPLICKHQQACFTALIPRLPGEPLIG